LIDLSVAGEAHRRRKSEALMLEIEPEIEMAIRFIFGIIRFAGHHGGDRSEWLSRYPLKPMARYE
jgi:hypothetical protein